MGSTGETRISKDVRSDGRCIHDCQTVGVNLTIPDGLGVNEDGAQITKRKKPKGKLVSQHHSNTERGEKMALSFLLDPLSVRICV